jgi:hypothetical protein
MSVARDQPIRGVGSRAHGRRIQERTDDRPRLHPGPHRCGYGTPAGSTFSPDPLQGLGALVRRQPQVVEISGLPGLDARLWPDPSMRRFRTTSTEAAVTIEYQNRLHTSVIPRHQSPDAARH